MSLSLMLTAILTISAAVVILSSLESSVNAIVVNNTYFSIDIPDNWSYQDYYDSNGLTPNEFGILLIDSDKSIKERIHEDGGAYAWFRKNPDFTIKNAGLDLYVNSQINEQDAMNITSKQNVTIDNEPAVKIYADGGFIPKKTCGGICIGNDYTQNTNFTGMKFVQYMTMHNKEPYDIGYVANVKNFNKYLPQFEQMVKTFKFAK